MELTPELGAHCLSVASLRTAGVGEPRRAPKELAPAEAGGHATANMVLGPFAETKGPRRLGAKPHCNFNNGFSLNTKGNDEEGDFRLKISGATG